MRWTTVTSGESAKRSKGFEAIRRWRSGTLPAASPGDRYAEYTPSAAETKPNSASASSTSPTTAGRAPSKRAATASDAGRR